MIGDFYTHNKKGGRYKVVNLAEFKAIRRTCFV